MQNVFTSIVQLFHHYGICRRDMHNWRLIKEPPAGEIHGLPDSHGLLIATNGMLCFIQREGCKELFCGHLDYFIAYRPNTYTVLTINGELHYVGTKVRAEKKKQEEVNLKAALDDLLKL